jgi:Domain of unknown function (DUF1990)
MVSPSAGYPHGMTDSTAAADRPVPGRVKLAAGALRMTVRHLVTLPATRRRRGVGDSANLPTPWPADFVDDRTKNVTDGFGPLFHRVFSVRAVDTDCDAAGLIARITADLDRPAPDDTVRFARERGEPGAVAVGDEYRVYMPAPWDGPVRVLARDDCRFLFGTLEGHLEAGQIEFRAADEGPGRVSFTIEAWSRAGTRGSEVAYRGLNLGKEVQAGLWIQYCLGAVEVSGGRRDGRVDVMSRRVPESDITS